MEDERLRSRKAVAMEVEVGSKPSEPEKDTDAPEEKKAQKKPTRREKKAEDFSKLVDERLPELLKVAEVCFVRRWLECLCP